MSKRTLVVLCRETRHADIKEELLVLCQHFGLSLLSIITKSSVFLLSSLYEKYLYTLQHFPYEQTILLEQLTILNYECTASLSMSGLATLLVAVSNEELNL